MKRAVVVVLLALSLLVPWPVVLHAAVAHVQTTTTNDSAASSTTLVSSSITLTAGNLLIAGIGNLSSAVAISTVRLDGSTNFTQGATQVSNNDRASVWYLPNIPSGSHTVTVT